MDPVEIIISLAVTVANNRAEEPSSAQSGYLEMVFWRLVQAIVPKSDIIVPNSLWLFGIFVVPLHP